MSHRPPQSSLHRSKSGLHELKTPRLICSGLCVAGAFSWEAFVNFSFMHSSVAALPPVPDGESAAPWFTGFHGGLAGSTHKLPQDAVTGAVAQEVVFVGIIDMLVPFNASKKMENFAKGWLLLQENFSVVPPDTYAARFTEANTAIVETL